MPTHFDPVHLGPNVIGIVDHPMGQPQKALFDRLEVAGHNSVPLSGVLDGDDWQGLREVGQNIVYTF